MWALAAVSVACSLLQAASAGTYLLSSKGSGHCDVGGTLITNIMECRVALEVCAAVATAVLASVARGSRCPAHPCLRAHV